MQESTEINEFRSTCGISYDQLQKFWNGLPGHGRQELLKVDKQTFLEKVRKNNFCSRCYGFLVEEFSQIVMHWKSSRQHGAVAHLSCNGQGIPESQIVGGLSQGDDQDHWGCLTTTTDGTQTLTLLDCYFRSDSIEGIQKVFDSARTSESERNLLYPFACGVGGRKWKGPASREACVVHTVRLPLEILVDFWSSQGDESRQSLLKMKEEDFVEQLTFRIDDYKFCRHCKKNIFQEFKKFKELTSIRKESGLHFQYEISHDTVRADWSQTFMDTYGSYLHFEWGVGSAKGKSDISAFKSVGLSKIVQVSGLDLSGLDECYINLRAWKTDGDCTELSVKAHTTMGQQYGHCRLVVGDGFVTVTEGESILNFFKHAEEVVKEDNNLLDKNGNRLDRECSHPQRDARNPESARKFLLDAATVVFKEQFKLLQDEDRKKNEEEERKERRRNKEREKKLRRKERTKEKEKNGDNSSFTEQHLAPQVNIEDSTIVGEETDANETVKVTLSRPVSPHIQDEKEINEYMKINMHNSSDVSADENFASSNSKNGASELDQSKYSEWKLKKQHHQDETVKVMSSRPPHIQDEKEINEYMESNKHNSSDVRPDENFASSNSKNGSSGLDQSKCSEWKLKKRHHQDETVKVTSSRPVSPHIQDEKEMNEYMESNKHNSSDVRRDENFASSNSKNGSSGLDQSKCSEWKLEKRHHQDTTSKSSINKQFAVVPGSGTMVNKSEKSYHDDHFDSSSRTANRQNKHSRKAKSIIRAGEMSKPPSFGEKFTLGDHIHDTVGRPKRTKEVVEPEKLQMKYVRSQSKSDGAVRSSNLGGDATESCKPLQTTGTLLNNINGQKTGGIKDKDDVNSDISQDDQYKGFSFFHFGSPADAYKSDFLPSEDSVGGHSLVTFIHHNAVDLTRNKRDSLEEYNLFATNKGISFFLENLVADLQIQIFLSSQNRIKRLP